MAEINFTKGKKKRKEELSLPHLHYVAAMNWMDQLGEKTFCIWLKFITMCDRSDKDREDDKIPYSKNVLMKKLGIKSKTTMQKHLKTLWDYGFIDLEEYGDPDWQGNRPVNVIVYESPQNDTDLQTRNLEKVRDYEKDYSSDSKKFGHMRGKKKQVVQKNEPTPVQKNEPTPVQKNEPSPVQKNEPNNVSNNLSNDSNIIINDSNKSINLEKIQNLDVPEELKEVIKKEIKRLIDWNISLEDIQFNYSKHKNEIKSIIEYTSAFQFVMNNDPRFFDKFMDSRVPDSIEYYESKRKKHNLKVSQTSEILPEWFKDLQEQESTNDKNEVETESVDMEELEERYNAIISSR